MQTMSAHGNDKQERRSWFAAVATVLSLFFSGAAFAEDQQGFIGLQVQGLNAQAAAALGLAEPKGVLVRDIASGGPADHAGIRQGDLIVRMAGEDIDTFEKLLQVASKAKPEQKIPVNILRAGKTVEVQLTAGKWPPSWKIDRDATGHLPEAGLTMVALTDKIRNRFSVRWGTTGVLVTLVDESRVPGSGVKRGEIIRQVNQEDVWLPDHVIARYKQAKTGKRGTILLLVDGPEGLRYVPLAVK